MSGETEPVSATEIVRVESSMEIVDELSVVDMRFKFAGWEEDWVDPDETRHPFAVRELAPDAADWLAEYGTLSVRDMRHIAGLLRDLCKTPPIRDSLA